MRHRGGLSPIHARSRGNGRTFWQRALARIRTSDTSGGFTLIELLTVIFIIGIITTVVSVNLSSARKQARDVRRKTDLSTLQSAIELYANANNGKVPASPAGTSSLSWDPNLSTALSAYLSAIPLDPIVPNASPYLYTYQTGPAGTQFQNSYALDTTLEVEKNTNIVAPSQNAGTAGFYITGTYKASDGTIHYRVSSGGQ